MVRVEPSRGPTLTVAQRRRDAVEQLGAWMFNRRMSREVAAGTVAFSDISASVGQWYGALRTARVDASGKPEAWQAMLTDLGVALQRARLHGFSEQDLEEARTAFLAEAEQAVQQESTRRARAVLHHLNAKVARREPIASAAQNLAILKQLLPGITAAEVSGAFAANFDPTNVVFVAELPWVAPFPARPSWPRPAAPPSPRRPPRAPRSRGPPRCSPRRPRAAWWRRAWNTPRAA